MRHKIDDIRTNRRLTPETHAIKTMCSDPVPDNSFGLRQLAPQAACSRPHFWLHPPNRPFRGLIHRLFQSVTYPLPVPPPQAGEGGVAITVRADLSS